MEIKEIIKEEIEYYDKIAIRKNEELKETKDKLQKEILMTQIETNISIIVALTSILRRIEKEI